MESVLDSLFKFKIDNKRFGIYKEQYIRGLNNFKAEQPYSHAIYYLALLLSEVSWTKSELLQAAERKVFILYKKKNNELISCYFY